MQDISFGILAILAGSFFCFRGYAVLRVAITFWGAFAGLSLGAGLVSEFTGDRFLGTVLGWSLGIVLALVFAIFAYLYYFVGVVIAMASVGFVLGTALIVALGVDWNWVIVVAGIVAGALVALVAVLTDLPNLLLVLFSALGGASVTVAGLMLLFGVIDSTQFNDKAFTRQIPDDWWWYVLFLVLAGGGAFAQSRDMATRRGMRQGWS